MKSGGLIIIVTGGAKRIGGARVSVLAEGAITVMVERNEVNNFKLCKELSTSGFRNISGNRRIR